MIVNNIMIVLVIDSSTTSILLYVLKNNSVITFACEHVMNHAEDMVFYIREFLRSNGLYFQDLTHICIISAPGNIMIRRICFAFCNAYVLIYKINLHVICKFSLLGYIINRPSFSIILKDRLCRKYYQNFCYIKSTSAVVRLFKKSSLLKETFDIKYIQHNNIINKYSIKLYIEYISMCNLLIKRGSYLYIKHS